MSTATLSCKCGQVSVNFAVNQGRSKIYCCCDDCFAKNAWAARMGGPQIPDKCESKEAPMWVEHWSARMVVVGKEKLTFNKLREQSPCTNCVAACCSTLLFVDSPFYQGNVVSIFPEMVNLQNAVHREKFDFVSFIRDWPSECQSNIDQSLPSWYFDENGQVNGSGRWQEAFQDVAGRFSVPAEEGEGQLFAELLQECGGSVTILDQTSTPSDPM